MSRENLSARLLDFSTLKEAEFVAFLDRFEPAQTQLSPAFEDFLKKLVKRRKGVVRGAVKLAKKGVKLASKLSRVRKSPHREQRDRPRERWDRAS